MVVLLTDFFAALIILILVGFFVAMWLCGVMIIGVVIGFFAAIGHAIFGKKL